MSEKIFYGRPNYPKLIVISGPSGVGKDTIARQLIETNPTHFHFVVTATTRPPRIDEIEGDDYIFVSNEEFAGMIEADEMLEWAIVYNDYKGVPKQQIRDALASGKDVIMRVDVQGAATIRKIIPNAIFIFLVTETEEDLVNRLIERKSETSEGLRLRTAMAHQEMKRMSEFDYVVINAEDDQEEAVNEVLSIVRAAHCQVKQSPVIL